MTGTGTGQGGEPSIVLESVWKVFGERATEALTAIEREGLGKPEVLERFDCVVGVADASFTVRRGEVFCVMGLSGSGKSTLVRHVNRLLMPTAGRVFVHGRDIIGLPHRELLGVRNREIAMVFQDFGLMPHRSVRDNVSMPLEIRGVAQNQRWTAAQRALDMVSLGEWGDKYAHELSGGMQQRVGLARAIAADTEVLLMDEPFSALDPLIRRQLQDEFSRLASSMRKTTVFITHDLEEAVRIGDRIAIMRDGAIVQIGTPEEIIMRPADGYVFDFVAGISRINLIRAHSIMTPIDAYSARHGAPPDGALCLPEDTTLRRLIDAAQGLEAPVIITNGGAQIGVVTKDDLLGGVIKGTQDA